MRDRNQAGVAIFFLPIAALALNACTRLPPAQKTIIGSVITLEGQSPVPGALVTLRASEFQTLTQENGTFSLRIPEQTGNYEIAAWAPGYYIAFESLETMPEDLTLALRPYHTRDWTDYEWIDPAPASSENACGNCHPLILSQWTANAHARSVRNPRFFSFYNGTDTVGNPLDAPGYLPDFPGTAGSCANCHAPGAALDAPFTSDMNASRDLTTAGIHCDLCHKVENVYLDPATSSPYTNVPGVLSMRLLRPPEGEQIFIGPYADIHDPDTYAPIFSESAFCAPCHQFSFWGTEIYNSYGEWLASDYAEQGITCQDCHMPPSGDTIFAVPEQGGLEHPAEVIPSHYQLGLEDEAFMQTSLELAVEHGEVDGKLIVEVSITNSAAGHHVPTDHPGRHLILLVQAFNADGVSIPLQGGSILPDWIGDLSGKPGVVYTKVLEDARTGRYPAVDYWNPMLIQSDNRIPANQIAVSEFTFNPADHPTRIQVSVIFRRMFQPIADSYGWQIPETTMVERSIELTP